MPHSSPRAVISGPRRSISLVSRSLMVGGGGEPSQGGRGRLETVQAIRAIAALLVATTHGMGESLKAVTPPGHSLLSVCVDRGQFGVDLFFVVSGFILAHISYAQLSKPAYAKHFIIRRIARVVPVYWFYLTMMIGITLALPHVMHTKDDLTVPYVLASYGFFPFPRPSTGAPEPVLGLGWTLNYEMYFYIVFCFAIMLFKKDALKALLAYFAVAFLIGQLLQPQSLALASWTNDIVFEFGYGILIALAFNNRHRPSRPLAFTMFFLGIAVWLCIGLDPDLSITPGVRLSVYQWRGFLWGVPAGLIVASLTLGTSDARIRQHPGLRSLAKLGDASYSLYLVHLCHAHCYTSIAPCDGYIGHLLSGRVLCSIPSCRRCRRICLLSCLGKTRRTCLAPRP